ncbi:MAG: ribosomal protein L6, alpha-beta domain-containing protein [Olpidium bornovanus]|uniref:Ribosomal protein L6, alpha-beta domain-containing protein n=1 Tax=Olpidium bornovanus TaxID=278681 RepID=A0A8H7ZN63_9FUNG|nr:MAG: ribosomal protein L6, alpha-beta domain-containing protein [Olpidium bornovanus]
MRDTFKDESVAIPADVTVDVKARRIRVKGPRGTLTKDLHHLDMEIVKKGKTVQFQVWHGKRKHVACLRTARSLIQNLITGVTKGFEFRMRYVYAHFPINVVVNNDHVEIRNFLGEKIVRRIPLREGVTCEISNDVKDELILRGNSLENVSQTGRQPPFWPTPLHPPLPVLPLFGWSRPRKKKSGFLTLLFSLSCSAADIQQSTAVKRKDIRKFLDGVYVSKKGTLGE